jgi:uncharacterized protein (TIGR03435 family)
VRSNLPWAVIAAAGFIFIGAMAAHRLVAQSDAIINIKPSGPKFEVASIRLARSFQEQMQAGLKPHVGITADGAIVNIGYWSVLQLIVRAYKIQPYQLIGPDWMQSARFDVQATLPEDATQKQLPEMLQWLLAERFGLLAHAETRELPGWALRVGQGGPKMKPGPSEPDAGNDPAAKDEANVLDLLWGSGAGQPFGVTALNVAANGDLHMQFQKLPMPVLAQILTSYLRVPVADRTGLEGSYEVTLDFSPQSPIAPSNGNDLFRAVKELGLKLEPYRMRANVLVVDHVECHVKHNLAVWQGYGLIRSHNRRAVCLGSLLREAESSARLMDCQVDGLPFTARPRW